MLTYSNSQGLMGFITALYFVAKLNYTRQSGELLNAFPDSTAAPCLFFSIKVGGSQICRDLFQDGDITGMNRVKLSYLPFLRLMLCITRIKVILDSDESSTVLEM